MDFFYQILTQEGRRFILHIEFQTDNDSEMVYRAAEYHGMALRRKKMPIEHVVIYLGVEKPSMLTRLPEEEVYTGFHLVNMQAFEAGQLLNSQLPEVILLAILAHYPAEQTELVLRYVIRQLRAGANHFVASEKHQYHESLMLMGSHNFASCRFDAVSYCAQASRRDLGHRVAHRLCGQYRTARKRPVGTVSL